MDPYGPPPFDFAASMEDTDAAVQILFGSSGAPGVGPESGGGGDGDAAPHGVGSSGSTSAHTTSSTGAKRTRSTTSGVWNDFQKVFVEEDGVPVRYAKCNICKNTLTAKSTGGTGHLIRHAEKCKKKAGYAAMQQTMLQYNPDGTVRHWEYSSDTARQELCRLIAKEDLPLGFGESPAFEEYIKRAHNPRFSSVSRQTTTRDLIKYYNDCRIKLKTTLQSCTFSVALTSDIWSGNAKEDYLSVVAHFVNDNWELEKRVIGFRLIDVAHSGENIAERIAAVVNEYELSDKIFAITLDNASSNSRAMESLAPILSGYMGTTFLHQRCACHIINLIVKSGLKHLQVYLNDFRTAISFLNSLNQRIAAYKNYCIATGVRPRKFGLDMDVRWNSTYFMLKHLVPYRSTFSVFIHTHYHAHGGQTLLTDSHWYVAEKILEFLEQFYDSTVTLSGIYYPTSPLILHHIIEIASHLMNYEHDSVFAIACIKMKDKFLKYWRNIPMLYAFAFILDPRAKLHGLTNVLQILSQLTSNDYSEYFNDVRAKVNEIYVKYEAKYGTVRLQRPPPAPSSTGKKKTAWEKIFGPGTSSSSSKTSSPAPALSSPVTSTRSELSMYLDSDTLAASDDDSFNLMAWWHEHKLTYPVLSLLARDVLTVPVSTTSSESAFSLTGRILEDRRRSLTSEMVEILTIVKDWEQAEGRSQHNVENQELQLSFENLYLDVDDENA